MLDKVLRNIKKSLKDRHCVIGKEEKYLNAAVLIPLIEIDHEVHVLFQVRSPHIRQGGEIGLPGGMIEEVDNGDYEATAVRETTEELGIERDDINVIGHLGTLVSHSSVALDVYVGVLACDNLEKLPLSDEVESIFTVPLTTLLYTKPEIHHVHLEVKPHYLDENGNEVILLDAKALGLPEKYSKSWSLGRRKVYFYPYEDKMIWGMTGEIIYEFLKLVRDK